MTWLNLNWDGEVVYQFSRAARHAEVAHALLAAGHAYRCYATPEELTALREEQRAARQPMRYDGRWRDRTDWPNDADYVIRLKAPREGSVTIDDQVQGPVTVNNAELDDFVLLRSDGTPTYMLAVVVDDHDMGVTHVIRGDDHLNNAFRQLALIRAMQWPEPVYAHIPLIHGADGAKLSKRHGALGVDAYRDELGLLPEAVENYLLRLGWGYGDAEIISRDEAVQWFELAGVGRSPSRFDMKKLENLNGQYLRAADDGRLVALITGRVAAALGRELADSDTALLQRTMPELKKRANNLNDLAASSLFYLRSRPIPMDEGAAKLLASATPGLLDRARARFAAQDDWTAAALEQVARELAESEAAKLGQIAQPLRAAVTGSAQSPGLFEVLEVLGRQEVLGRIDDALAG
jgi:glutamyl-tRNA synthetase